MPDLPFLTGPDLAGLATEADAVGFLDEALRSGRVDPEADSPRLFSPAPGGEFLLMPTASPAWSGVKMVTVAPDNPARGKPKIQGVYTLFDSGDLAPVALVDRCAADGLRVRAGTSDDVRDAAVVVCATSSSTPVLDDRLVPPDAVVAAVGAHGTDRAELPPELVRRADVAVEGRASAMRESGNLLGARTAEEWADLPVANLGDLAAGRFGRRPGHPAVFSGVGMAWEDLVVAAALHERHRLRRHDDAQPAAPTRDAAPRPDVPT
jgi:ornithine cyclodeaminase/alanine dehydrogenase-like protein (mu-crystallin family)